MLSGFRDESVCVCVSAGSHAWVRAHICACVRVCEYARGRVCVCVRARVCAQQQRITCKNRIIACLVKWTQAHSHILAWIQTRTKNSTVR